MGSHRSISGVETMCASTDRSFPIGNTSHLPCQFAGYGPSQKVWGSLVHYATHSQELQNRTYRGLIWAWKLLDAVRLSKSRRRPLACEVNPLISLVFSSLISQAREVVDMLNMDAMQLFPRCRYLIGTVTLSEDSEIIAPDLCEGI